MKKFTPIILSIAAVVLGIVFVISGIKTIADRDLYDTTVTATVVDVQEEWVQSADSEEADHLEKTAYIEYEVNGEKFGPVIAPTQDENIKVGDTQDILCQSKNPSKISSLNPTKGGVIFIVLGALAAVAGCVSTIRIFIKKR